MNTTQNKTSKRTTEKRTVESIYRRLKKRYNIPNVYDQLSNDIKKELISLYYNVEDREIERIEIHVTWSKNRTWGYCPKAKVTIIYVDHTTMERESRRITGCGYDKLSTAIAEVLNEIPLLRKKLLDAKYQQINLESDQSILGYGAGYGLIPYFESGVGENTLLSILEAIGYKTTYRTRQPKYDIYVLERINN